MLPPITKLGAILAAIAWNGNQFVAVGSNQTILTSPNGIDWTLHPMPLET